MATEEPPVSSAGNNTLETTPGASTPPVQDSRPTEHPQDTSVSSNDASPDVSLANAHVVSLRLLFTAWITHFRSLGYVKDQTMDLLDKTVLKKTVELTVRDSKARLAIGTSERVWSDIADLFRVAIPSLEGRTYVLPPTVTAGYDANGVPYDTITTNGTVTPAQGNLYEGSASGPSSNMMVQNSGTLLRDLQRLDSILALARNALTAGEQCQNLAAQVGFDREVCGMINLCVKITARGFDGDGSSAVDEEKWNAVVNGFKKLLITSLQFLSNMVTMNERLKLMLWVELFDNGSEMNGGSAPGDGTTDGRTFAENWVTAAANQLMPLRLSQTSGSSAQTASTQQSSASATAADNSTLAEAHVADSGLRYNDYATKQLPTLQPTTTPPPPAPAPTASTSQPGISQATSDSFPAISQGQPDYRMIESAADGARKLAEGKSQLLKRLQSANMAVAHPQPVMSPASPVQVPDSPPREEPEVLDEEEEEELEDEEDEEEDEEEEEEEDISGEEESSDDDDYAVPGEDGRGLLTDVPLILGPNEIEVLPMIIMSGIVPPTPDPNKAKTDESSLSEGAVSMYTIRCHLLLAQENGRNLLRELLIFVAAWDLREEELYFKFMVKIMEAILMNGLMPFAYNAFKESKDIISPAQAVIMKLLTKIFHSRQAYVNSPNTLTVPPRHLSPSRTPAPASFPSAPLRFDIQIVHFLFSEFRQNIIPQICALIFLQGQIRQGCANLEDFPLNLWDMERMYEGVYQYLEFFAILTDHESWKVLMAEWEVAYELVTLLRELEVAIPKGGLVRVPSVPEPLVVGKGGANRQADAVHAQQQQYQQQQQHYPPPQQHLANQHQPHQQPPQQQNQQQNDQRQPAPTPAPVTVERPYDIASPTLQPQPPTHLPTSTLPPPTLPAPPLSPSPSASATNDPETTYPSPLHDEPADFEWRNLKKLCVLVLSSLVWKNPLLQDQVRDFDGIPAILSCCSYDEHNPYIREHAIMCLRFLLEGNVRNMELVRGFAEQDGRVRGVVGEAVVGAGQMAGAQTAGQAAGMSYASTGALPAGAQQLPTRHYPPPHTNTNTNTSTEAYTSYKHPQYQHPHPQPPPNQYSNPPAQHYAQSQSQYPQHPQTQTQYQPPVDHTTHPHHKITATVPGHILDPVTIEMLKVGVPGEVLDKRGYETFMDGEGRVGLRRKDGSNPGNSGGSGGVGGGMTNVAWGRMVGMTSSEEGAIPGTGSGSGSGTGQGPRSNTEEREYAMASSLQQARELINGVDAVGGAQEYDDGVEDDGEGVGEGEEYGEGEYADDDDYEGDGNDDDDDGQEDVDEDVEDVERKGGEDGKQGQGQMPEKWSKGLPGWVQMVVDHMPGPAGAGGVQGGDGGEAGRE